MINIALVKSISGVADDTIVSAAVEMAGLKIREKLYPFDSDNMEIPEKYKATQIEIALYILRKMTLPGITSVEGQTYESGSIPESMLKNVVPMCKVP